MVNFENAARLRADRQREIYHLALRKGSVEVADLAQRFDITTETIRRDLSDLQSQQQLRRVHGGAVCVEQARHERTVDARDMQNADEKLRIAQTAIAEVPTQGSVAIDSGSTLQRLAEVFPIESGAHVVTNSLVVALTLSRRGIAELTVLGGGVRTNTFAMVDAFTVETVKDLRFDVLFISCDGLSLHRGLTTPYREEAAVKSAMIKVSDKVVALVDQSKLGNGQMFPFATLNDIDILVTDDRIDATSIEILSDAGIDVHVA